MAAILDYADIESIPKIHDDARAAFASGKSRDIAFRKLQLLQLAYMLQDNAQRWQIALSSDLGRPAHETTLLELSPLIKHALTAYKKVGNWAKPDSVPFDLQTYPLGGKVLKEPKGTILIIGPFNYPIWCVVGPLIGAVAAGCAAVIKPSEMSPATAALLSELLPRYLDPEFYKVVNGEIPQTTKLLELQWDHIMYTGNGIVGRIVATAAAKHLTPITLELGGKSPVVVDNSADLKVVARRLLWGKSANVGQTCTAPDYVLIPEERQAALLQAFKDVYPTFFPPNEGGASGSKSLSRIVNERHFDRLAKVMENSTASIVVGGDKDRATKFIAPTVFSDVKESDSLMESELFGPLLPIVPVKDIDSAIKFIKARSHPLALYVFGDKKASEKVFSQTTSGSAIANDVIIHGGVEGLPFGGVGESGYGSHGDKAGFSTFTHFRASMNSPNWVDLVLSIRFPPYTAKKQATVKNSMPKIPFPRPGTKKAFSWGKWLTVAGVIGGIIAYRQKLTGGR